MRVPGQSRMVAILPCNDLEAAEKFFARLDFLHRGRDKWDGYRLLTDPSGAELHLTDAVEGWVVPGKNPFGLYLFIEDVDGMAARFAGETIPSEGPSLKPWGVYEFAINGPDDVLIRVGWPR